MRIHGMRLADWFWWHVRLPLSQVNWMRVAVVVNLCITTYLIYSVYELHRVVNDLGDAQIFAAEVVEFIYKLIDQRIEQLEKILFGVAGA